MYTVRSPLDNRIVKVYNDRGEYLKQININQNDQVTCDNTTLVHFRVASRCTTLYQLNEDQTSLDMV